MITTGLWQGIQAASLTPLPEWAAECVRGKVALCTVGRGPGHIALNAIMQGLEQQVPRGLLCPHPQVPWNWNKRTDWKPQTQNLLCANLRGGTGLPIASATLARGKADTEAPTKGT